MHVKEGVLLKGRGEPYEVFKNESNMIRFAFWNDHSATEESTTVEEILRDNGVWTRVVTRRWRENTILRYN